MRYVAAYMLSQLAGTADPGMGDLEKILGSVGVDCEKERATMVIKNLKGKDLEELIAQGSENLASMGGGAGPAAAAGAAAPAGGDAPAAAEEKKEKKKEESEEEDDDMGFGLFD